MKILRLLGHLLIASLVCFISASLLQTQMVLANLTELNIQIPMMNRLNMAWQDLLGLFPTYGLVVLIGFSVGFSIAKLVRRFTPFKSYIVYAFAGGVTMLVILLAMQPILGVTLLAGARSTAGIILQMLSGILGGICFMQLRKHSHHSQSKKE